MRRWLMLLLLAAASLGSPGVPAGEAKPLAEDELTEKRLIAIASELRCLVCQNESLAGSHAELANDLRREIRTLIRDGKSDSEIMEFMVNRYGDFVRYRPPLTGTTLLLWFGPGALFVVGLAALVRYLRRRDRAISDTPLTPDEQGRADTLLQDPDSRQGQP
ncbi:MAG: cytochrome c-type biogenesis protein CcmH [Candidatus Accumulibacter sp.]|uniref:Cytochrome c-type biogenesis protein n=1 Tax=Candidatus Accumulibacter affinis TaxID=2954384 RepID=A0A935T8E6_9PROT|nr:cytochrome c-type biogenesis protein CcmH [Candidatus Accumulibacter affinis]MBP9804791.1 cytochrome c-type biogenesis protein CcmH [Accumulibacter sp.]